MEGMDDFLSSGSGITEETNDLGSLLPRYFIYLSLGFKWILSLFILTMAGWVLVTIKTTRRLHKPHNIFVANLMITCIITVIIGTSLSMIVVAGHITGFHQLQRVHLSSLFRC